MAPGPPGELLGPVCVLVRVHGGTDSWRERCSGDVVINPILRLWNSQVVPVSRRAFYVPGPQSVHITPPSVPARPLHAPFLSAAVCRCDWRQFSSRMSYFKGKHPRQPDASRSFIIVTAVGTIAADDSQSRVYLKCPFGSEFT